MSLAIKLAEAREEVRRLEHAFGAATCRERGAHRMISLGGRNCGCHDYSACSLPVHECADCGACDYGENEEAAQIVADCKAYHPERHERGTDAEA